ncbi:hypothetical protein AX14_002704 [Amanita brunnescens Koide BX004]|nr:hypothetical protein AX14_002704 [Amanita brunnescens Koide BX004]
MTLSVPCTKKDPAIVEDRRSVRLDNLVALSYISHSQPVQMIRPGMTLTLEVREEIFHPMLVIYMKRFCYVLAVLSGLGTRFGVGQNWISQTACSFPLSQVLKADWRWRRSRLG